MAYLRPNSRLNVSTLDGWSDFILLQRLPWHMRDGRLLSSTIGANTDGLSSPKFIKCNLQSTNSFFPTISHDSFYRGDIDESKDEGLTWLPWKPEQYTKQLADQSLKELCEDNFVPQKEIDLIVSAVVEFGQSAWDNDSVSRNRIR